MQPKFLFITSRYFFQPTIDALSRLKPECGTKVVSYETFETISQVYEQYESAFNAVFVSGTSAKAAIELQNPNITKPLVAFQVSSDGLHRDILRFAIEAQKLDFSRIAMDFLLPMGMFSVVDFLRLTDIQPVVTENTDRTLQIGIRNSHTMEDFILDGIISLWEQNAIDLVICQYSSLIPKLQALGIPCRCPFISDFNLRNLINDTLVRLELQALHDNHPAVIQVFPRLASSLSSEQLPRLSASVRQFIQDHLIDCVVQESSTCCTIISSMKILRIITNEFQNCLISAYLEEHLDFSVAVGYGIGTTVQHAMNNTQIASKEAKLVGRPFVVDSNGSMIGPLNTENRMVIAADSLPDISVIAKRCSLSAMTIQKLLALTYSSGSDKITTQELAQRLETTVRNANRIMTNLCKGGVARPVYTQTSHSRGRPIQVYALDFSI